MHSQHAARSISRTHAARAFWHRPSRGRPRRRGGHHGLLGLVLVAVVLWSTGATPTGQTSLPYAEPAVAPGHADAIAAGRSMLQALVEQSGVPGLSVAVALDGVVVWAEGFGYADVENRVPVTPLTKFRIGSVSKPLTSMAIGLLHEQGHLDLDTPIQRYVPYFPEKRWPITVRQLAGHLAGIRTYDYADYDPRHNEFVSADAYDTVRDAIGMFGDDRLEHEPGSEYLYSSYGWNLISAAVEGAADQDYLSYMTQRVLAPLGLHDTVPDTPHAIVPFRTRFYARTKDGRLHNGRYADLSNKWAGGGWLSTPTDLVRWGSALLEPGRLLKPETVTLLWTPQRTTDGTTTHYGIGWRDDAYWDDRWTVSHGGGSVGGTTSFVIYPDDRLVIAMTANISSSPMSEATSRTIAEAFLPGSDAQPAPGLDPTGTYRYRGTDDEGVSIGGALQITRRGDRLTGRLVPDESPSAQRRAQDGSHSPVLPPEIPIARVTLDGTRAHIVGADAGGFVHLWIDLDGDTFSGRWFGRRASGAVSGTRSS